VRHALRERLDPEELFTALAPAHDNPRFDVQSLTSAGTCTVIVSGEVDSMTAPGLRDCLLDVLGRPHLRAVQVEVDLSRVAFLNAAGLTALAIAHQMADSAGRVLRIRCGTARAVLLPLQITGLWYAFNIIEQGRLEGNR
jgi:anti-sigma B factor antagonist